MRLPLLVLLVAVVTALLTFASPQPAQAYLDPGTGSYMLQLVIAALLGVAFSVKMFWLRIRTFFANLISRKPKDN